MGMLNRSRDNSWLPGNLRGIVTTVLIATFRMRIQQKGGLYCGDLRLPRAFLACPALLRSSCHVLRMDGPAMPGTERRLRLTLFVSRCYSRRVPFGRGFSVKRPTAGIVSSSLARVSPPQPNDSSSSPPGRPRIPPHSVRGSPERLNLFDDTTAHNSESTSTLVSEAEPTAADSSLSEQNQASAETAGTNTEPHQAQASDDPHTGAAGEDF